MENTTETKKYFQVPTHSQESEENSGNSGYYQIPIILLLVLVCLALTVYIVKKLKTQYKKNTEYMNPGVNTITSNESSSTSDNNNKKYLPLFEI